MAFIGTVVGVFVGLLAGFSGGWLDRILMVITDTFVVIPSCLFWFYGLSDAGSATVILMALVLAMFAWAWPSRAVALWPFPSRGLYPYGLVFQEGTVQVIVTEILLCLPGRCQTL